MNNQGGSTVSVGQGEENIRRNAPEESGRIADGGLDPILPEEVEEDPNGLLGEESADDPESPAPKK